MEETDQPKFSLAVGQVWRAKKPKDVFGFFDDRQITYVSGEGDMVQYDSPTVRMGRRFPTTTRDRFERWAGKLVALPEGDWAPYVRPERKTHAKTSKG